LGRSVEDVPGPLIRRDLLLLDGCHLGRVIVDVIVLEALQVGLDALPPSFVLGLELTRVQRAESTAYATSRRRSGGSKARL
jgi:hypothetical protein